MQFFHRLSLGLLLLLTANSFILQAQTTGDAVGIITDASGAAVPNAKVTLTSKDTGETRTVTSDHEGRYAFKLLKIGTYEIAVEASGFRRTVAEADVRSAEITSANLKLEVGQVTEQVVVTDAASPLDTQNSQVQQSVNSKEVHEIPVARNPNTFATILPGIVPPMGSVNSGSFVANGNRTRANNITIDNITATDVSVAGTGSTNNGPLNFSQIKEVKIITNNFSAEFGRNSGSQVQYITKSGTNEFHGEVYEELRNNVFNARDWFDQSGKPTVTRYNEFGGVFGGPIIHNKTFFFIAGEGLPTAGLGAARIAQVPTASMLAQVTDPTSKKLLSAYNLPAATSDQGTFGTVQQNASNATSFHSYSIRFDHQISEKDSIYGRFGTAYSAGTSSGNTFINTNIGGFGLDSTNTVYSVNVNETHIFGPTVVNEFRSGFGRTSPVFTGQGNYAQGQRVLFSNAQVNTFGPYEGGPQGRVQNTFQYGDTLTWTKGAHNFKFGGDFYRYQANSFFESSSRGVYTFLNWDDFAAGKPTGYTQSFGGTVRGHRTWLNGAFAQDDFRITPTLTLNLGVRFEVYGPISEVNGLSSNLDFNCRTSMGIAGTGLFGCLTVGKDSTATNYYPQPRIGFAWNPGGGKTVIRAGYGLVADFNYLNSITNQRFLPPLVVTQTITGAANFTGGNTYAALVAGTATIQAQGLAQVGKIPTNILNYGDVNPQIDPNLKNPQVHQWSFGVQREIWGGLVLKTSYEGTKGNFLQLTRQTNLNANIPAPATSLADESARTQQFLSSYNAMTGSATVQSTRYDPRFNVVNYYDNSGNSNYHSLQILATRPFRAGYSLVAGYTFGKSIDNVSDALSNLPNDSSLIADPRNLRSNRAISAFDIPQRVVVTHIWELPWGNNMSNKFLSRVLGGWGFSGISSWRSGFPVTFVDGPRLGVTNISVVTTNGTQRPNAAGPVNFNPKPAGSLGTPAGLTGESVAGLRISAYAASIGLSQPLLGNFGNLGRNSNRLNGLTDFDWNVYKNIKITERFSAQLRCEMYNIFNNHSFQDVNRTLTGSTFGQYTDTANNQRLLQLGAVIRF
jgi:hypothetical protein